MDRSWEMLQPWVHLLCFGVFLLIGSKVRHYLDAKDASTKKRVIIMTIVVILYLVVIFILKSL